MCWLQATTTLDPSLVSNDSPPLDHYLPSPCAVIFLVYLHYPSSPRSHPPFSARSSLLSSETASLPFPFPSQVLPNPVLLPGQRETVLFLSSCSRGFSAFINHRRLCSLFISPLYLICWENQIIMLSVLKFKTQRGRKCWRNVGNKGTWMDTAKERLIMNERGKVRK